MTLRGSTTWLALAVLCATGTARAQSDAEQAGAGETTGVVEAASEPAADAPGRPAEAESDGGTDAEGAPAERYGMSHWQPHWPRFHLVEGIAMVGAEAAAIAIYFTEPNHSAHWRDPMPLDGETRGAMRLGNWDEESTAAHVSDALFWPMLAWPVAVDGLFLAGLVHGDTDTALQMILMDMEAMAYTHFVTWLTTRLVGRVRPRHLECTEDDSCADRGVGPYASFISGHSSFAYAVAGLVCAQHITHPWLTGSVEGGAIACTSGLTLATVIGALRVMSDLHWASDVAFGAIIGSAFGWGVPFLFHYGRPKPPSIAIAPASAGDVGLSVFGFF